MGWVAARGWMGCARFRAGRARRISADRLSSGPEVREGHPEPGRDLPGDGFAQQPVADQLDSGGHGVGKLDLAPRRREFRVRGLGVDLEIEVIARARPRG